MLGPGWGPTFATQFGHEQNTYWYSFFSTFLVKCLRQRGTLWRYPKSVPPKGPQLGWNTFFKQGPKVGTQMRCLKWGPFGGTRKQKKSSFFKETNTFLFRNSDQPDTQIQVRVFSLRTCHRLLAREAQGASLGPQGAPRRPRGAPGASGAPRGPREVEREGIRGMLGGGVRGSVGWRRWGGGVLSICCSSLSIYLRVSIYKSISVSTSIYPSKYI